MEKSKVRESNIELLRNISMFMILVIHANFVALSRIDYCELVSNTIPSVTRYFIESLGIVAVNVFIFISGWFGINVTKKRVFSFIYLVLFFTVCVGFLSILLRRSSFNIGWLLDALQFSAKDWFIKSYLVLMIIAPILNSYCKTVDEKTQRYVMIAFFLFEAIYGWAMGGRRFFVDGYGPLHFIGLYVTAQYIHNHVQDDTAPYFLKKLFLLPKRADLSIFFIVAVINTVFVVKGSMFIGRTESIHALAYAYSNPLVIIGALYLLMFFSKLNMPYIKWVNWFGASSFAVYLFHSEGTVRSQFFSPQVQYYYENYSGVSCIGLIFLFLCLVYILSVLIDQLRIISWKYIWKQFESTI